MSKSVQNEFEYGERQTAEQSNGPEKFDIIIRFVHTLNQIFIGITCFYMTWYSFHVGFDALITWHALLTTIGYQLLMAEGILQFCSSGYGQKSIDRKSKTKIHWVLQGLGGVLAISGIIIEIYNRFLLNKNHFGHLHSIFGLISMIFLIISIFSGISALFGIELRKYVKPIYVKTTHNILTLTTFITGMVAIVIAYNTKSWIRRDDPGDMRFWMIAFTIVTIVITVLSPLKTLYQQIKTIFKI